MTALRGRPGVGERLRVALRSALHRFRTAGDAPHRAAEDEEELQFHLDMAAAENVARGMTPTQARAAARRDFGGLDALREEIRTERGLPWLEIAWRDLRIAARSLRRAPAFAATAIGVVALGIAGVTAIVPLVDTVLVEPLPYPHPDRLVSLWETAPRRGWEQSNASPANLLDWRNLPAFSGVAGHGWVGGWALSGPDGAERVTGVQVTGGFFSVLGTPLTLGRDFSPQAHFAPDEAPIVISDGLWRRRFAADPGILGRRIEIDGEPRTVIGVAPPGFAFPAAGLDVWVPFAWRERFREQEWFRRAHFVRGFGRLREGVPPERAAAELAALARRLEKLYPTTNEDMGAGLTPLDEWIVADVRPHLLVLLGAVGLLLLVACANVASLLFARASVRGREVALRGALGASRRRLLGQLLTETLLLAGAGGLLGTLSGFAASRVLVHLAGDTLPRATEIGIDPSVLAGALLLVLAAAVLFGVGPGLRVAGTPPAAALRSAGRTTTGDASLLRSRGTLMLAEVAMAVVLVAGAGLATRSLRELTAIDPGFEPQGRVAVSYDLPLVRYPETADVHAFHARVLARVRALPGVVSADLAGSLPLEGAHWTSDLLTEGRPAGDKEVEFARRIVTPGYFATMGVRRLAGPGFPAEVAATEPLVVVNRTLAERVSPGAPELAVGRRVAIDLDGEESPFWRRIVGVVGDEAVDGLAAPRRMEMFVPVGQEPLGAVSNGWAQRGSTLVVRAARDPEALLPALRAAMRELDPQVPLFDPRTLDSMLAAATARERLLVVLLSCFAALALALAVVGVYGLVAFAVAQRQREIGIRLALGAGPRHVARAIAAQALTFCGAGLLLGLFVAVLAGRGLRSLLHEIQPTDPPTLAAAAAILALAVLLAAALPAWRATRLDPLVTLRAE